MNPDRIKRIKNILDNYPPFVFTVFFCGTKSTHLDYKNPSYYPMGELVSTLARNHSGEEFVDWIIVDGPGSGNLQKDTMWVKPSKNIVKNSRGKFTGLGWEDNVNHALAVIKGEAKRNKESIHRNVNAVRKERIDKYDKVVPIFVNMIGWSRGGVTCHMLANAMYEDNSLRDIPVNIFALDPVPGSANFQSERIRLQENVREYVSIYALDERSIGFNPIIPYFFSGETKHVILPIHGRHATLVGNAAVDGSKGPRILLEPGLLVRDLAWRVLNIWGTEFKSEEDIISRKNDESQIDESTYYDFDDQSQMGGLDESDDQLENKSADDKDLEISEYIPYEESETSEEKIDYEEFKIGEEKIDYEEFNYLNLVRLLRKLREYFPITSIPGKLELREQDVELLFSWMESDRELYKKMHNYTYTAKDKRIGKGQGRFIVRAKKPKFLRKKVTKKSVPKISKYNLNIEKYLYYHLSIVRNYGNLFDNKTAIPQEFEENLGRLDFEMLSSEQSLLLNQAVLLNGMKVIFDQPAPVYPVTLQAEEKE